MKYPPLDKTPIKEIIFSISYNEIVDKSCFEKFINSEMIKNDFKKIIPIIGRTLQIDDDGISKSSSEINNGYQLRNNKEAIQLRTSSFSYHYLDEYQDFEKILITLLKYWNKFSSVITNDLTITTILVRYINFIKNDTNLDISHLIQLYPKRSNDREVLNFQNSVTFSYDDQKEFVITTVSTQPKKNAALLDISVNRSILKNAKSVELEKLFSPMREIKNRAFFDSITAKALVKYIDIKN